ncbi:helix-turn-helix protein [Haloactinopolyspora alba]|uniref:Helix-turn-helix protein n=1 Tax=Haloactinopolyspora alba TaxID=648780 RepID=A0A2P8D2H8_9ACTN|nr:helix-turn-helix transcriptional regulator [Haloactinopolyspora alba]PSK91417.1 helix-turn-helix protein [Haloactinopolyspora alba]
MQDDEAPQPPLTVSGWPSWGHPGADRDPGTRIELRSAGVVLRTARAHAGLSQRDLAERARLAHSTIERIERNRSSPRWSVINRAVATCELRFALVMPDGGVIDYAPLVLDRNAAFRRYPAHLMVYRVEKPHQWWNADGRQTRIVTLDECPPYSYRHWWRTRDRNERPPGLFGST